MNVFDSEIPGIRIFTPKKFDDGRGFFSETYNKKRFASFGITKEFVQDNQSLSIEPWTLRGLHFQIPPYAQDKILRVLRGKIFDVVVDIRLGSPTYGKHASFVLSAEEWNQIWIPIGFAHGICTMEPNTEVLYKMTNYYSPEHDRGILWNDPSLDIHWPADEKKVLLSDKDKKLPRLSELKSCFHYSTASE